MESCCSIIWDKVFKSGLSKLRGIQPLNNLLSPLLNTLSHLMLWKHHFVNEKKINNFINRKILLKYFRENLFYIGLIFVFVLCMISLCLASTEVWWAGIWLSNVLSILYMFSRYLNLWRNFNKGRIPITSWTSTILISVIEA